MEIVGRKASLYTRVPCLFAEELGVPYELVSIARLDELGAEAYAGNPTLKIPVMRDGKSVVFGAENAARAIVERAGRPFRVVWPETMSDDLLRNAHEILSHAMAAQVQIAMGTVVSGLPADNRFFVKALAGLDGSLRWLDRHLDAVVLLLPPRDSSFFEVALLCLIEHFEVRPTVPADRYPTLAAFARAFGARPSAQRTRYR